MADTAEDIRVEDVSSSASDEEMPGLEPTAEGTESTAGPKGSKQTRSEKKARKVVQRLGLKQVPGVLCVRVKKGKALLFMVNRPDVFKSGESTFVVFGEAKMDSDITEDSLRNANVSSLFEGADAPDLVPAEPEQTPAAAPQGGEGENEGVNPEYIQLVIDQANCTRAQAIEALKATNGDVVNAIMSLTVS